MTIMQDMEKEYILQGFDDLTGIGERKSLVSMPVIRKRIWFGQDGNRMDLSCWSVDF